MAKLGIVLLLFAAARVAAYPEYAARYNMISCTACHISPVGGGPRNVNGKLFGAHGYKMNPILAQDYVSADFRALYYYPERPGPSRDGMGLMSASVAGHAPLDEDGRIHLVIEHNLAGFTAGQFRDTYALFRLSTDEKPAWFESILVGRFRPPFGYVTDEHRTYTRVQTATEWYSFESGFLLSGRPAAELHYDFGLVNGEDSPGQSLNQGQALRWGTLANIRWMPGPVMFGVSGSYHDHNPNTESRYAATAYAVLSIARWTDDRVPVSWVIEHTRAWNWDDHLGQGFASDNAYVSSLHRSRSAGWLSRLEWSFTPHLIAIYKFDFLTPDTDFPSDYYSRHGFGIRWIAGPNVIVQARTEFAQATHPSESASIATGGQSASFALLQLAL